MGNRFFFGDIPGQDFQMDGSGQGGVYMPFGMGYMGSNEARQAVPKAEAEMAKRQADFMAAQPHTRTQRMMAGQGDPYAAMARPWAQDGGAVPAMGRAKSPYQGSATAGAGMFGHGLPPVPSAVPAMAGPAAGRPGPASAAELGGYNAVPNPARPRR